MSRYPIGTPSTIPPFDLRSVLVAYLFEKGTPTYVSCSTDSNVYLSVPYCKLKKGHILWKEEGYCIGPPMGCLDRPIGRT